MPHVGVILCKVSEEILQTGCGVLSLPTHVPICASFFAIFFGTTEAVPFHKTIPPQIRQILTGLSARKFGVEIFLAW
jgi:hypothetical protein